MIKYKVKEVADDFQLKSKDITTILEEKCGVSKKSASTPETEERNVLFDALTQQQAVADFSAYLAARDNAIKDMEAEPVVAVKKPKPKAISLL